ncbi:hypothetical protein GCM10011594_23240 [Nakamurella endophytica]|uniref:Uncharacterized protein n=1 Tax=Nakamurella endophytica TaxID=1748367 RepID=A0A917SY29_9ACTN|nr:hypothetical protein GCM10011594_23240 [Nakamurella endophytica]
MASPGSPDGNPRRCGVLQVTTGWHPTGWPQERGPSGPVTTEVDGMVHPGPAFGTAADRRTCTYRTHVDLQRVCSALCPEPAPSR